MDDRVLFKKGQQRKFLDLFISNLGCISLHGILQFGFNIPYSTLKNYYSERRLLPRQFFEELCHIAKIEPSDLRVKYLRGTWGQVKGGKKRGKR